MEILAKEDFEFRKEEILHKIKKGALFIHPTDTIYGIGCDATNSEAVAQVRAAKERQDNPFSIIAPDKDWIKENCELNGKAKKWLDKLPGPYTLILNLKNKEAIAPNVNPGKDSVGVRIPDHWFAKAVEELGIPIITTSVNKAGEDRMTSTEDIHVDIRARVDFIIYEGQKDGKPSTIVDLTGDEEKVISR